MSDQPNSFVSMDVEAGKPSEPLVEKTPVPAGTKLLLIEVASILIIGITSYTIALEAMKYCDNAGNADDEDNANNANNCDNKYQLWQQRFDYSHDAVQLNYALSVGAISLVACLVARGMAKASPDSVAVTRILPGLMTLWWFFGTGYITTVGPYNAACTG